MPCLTRKKFKARADLRAARLERERGNSKDALASLRAILKLDPRVIKAEVEQARKDLDEVSRANKARAAPSPSPSCFFPEH